LLTVINVANTIPTYEALPYPNSESPGPDRLTTRIHTHQVSIRAPEKDASLLECFTSKQSRVLPARCDHLSTRVQRSGAPTSLEFNVYHLIAVRLRVRLWRSQSTQSAGCCTFNLRGDHSLGTLFLSDAHASQNVTSPSFQDTCNFLSLPWRLVEQVPDLNALLYPATASVTYHLTGLDRLHRLNGCC